MSDFPIIRETFKDYSIKSISVYNAFNKKYRNELIITNYSLWEMNKLLFYSNAIRS